MKKTKVYETNEDLSFDFDGSDESDADLPPTED